MQVAVFIDLFILRVHSEFRSNSLYSSSLIVYIFHHHYSPFLTTSPSFFYEKGHFNKLVFSIKGLFLCNVNKKLQEVISTKMMNPSSTADLAIPI